MSERGRLPRRFIDERRGHPDVRVIEDRRGYSNARLVGERRGYPDFALVEDQRAHQRIRVAEDQRAYHGIHEGPPMRGPPPRPHLGVLEEFELQEVELRRLMADNRALVEERAVLHRDIQGGKDEVQHLNMVIADINNEKEQCISKLVDKRRKLEAELRVVEPLREEVMQLRSEIEKLVSVRKELSAQVASLMQELAREKSGKQQEVSMLKSEIDGLRQEIIHLRTACGVEQKGNFELVEQRKAMEKNMISMAQEIEQMRAELAKFEVRPWSTGGTYGTQMGSPEATFAAPYGDTYNTHLGISDKGPVHLPESSSWSTYEKTRLYR